jgi:divalent metal cation (Fe/Co/Zn/Cd) transporter
MRGPYGHGKVETSRRRRPQSLPAAFVVIQAIRRLLGDQPDIDVGVGLAAMITAAVVNLLLAFFMQAVKRERSSSAGLRAESKHLPKPTLSGAP